MLDHLFQFFQNVYNTSTYVYNILPIVYVYRQTCRTRTTHWRRGPSACLRRRRLHSRWQSRSARLRRKKSSTLWPWALTYLSTDINHGLTCFIVSLKTMETYCSLTARTTTKSWNSLKICLFHCHFSHFHHFQIVKLFPSHLGICLTW